MSEYLKQKRIDELEQVSKQLANALKAFLSIMQIRMVQNAAMESAVAEAKRAIKKYEERE